MFFEWFYTVYGAVCEFSARMTGAEEHDWQTVEGGNLVDKRHTLQIKDIDLRDDTALFVDKEETDANADYLYIFNRSGHHVLIVDEDAHTMSRVLRPHEHFRIDVTHRSLLALHVYAVTDASQHVHAFSCIQKFGMVRHMALQGFVVEDDNVETYLLEQVCARHGLHNEEL